MSPKKILQLNSSIMGEQSYSRKLGNAIVEKIQEKYPESTVEQLDLVESNIPHFTSETLQAMFTPPEHQTDEIKQRLDLSDKLVKQLFDADIIVVGAPLINPLYIPLSNLGLTILPAVELHLVIVKRVYLWGLYRAKKYMLR